MKTNYLNWLLLLAFSIGIIGAGLLMYDEIKTTNVCPKLLGIPACYIIFFCFMIPFFAHIAKGKNIIYFLFTGIAFVIALIASIMQFTGLGECPKTDNGTPMCYYSLLLFTILIFLKRIIMKNKKTIANNV
ncbi:hypothetical protein [uncultured Tenacibaculum sp.]|uniref:hypothetical protein n=1 Tax=uncultured Tenacibaculum sp. TaxID=174713 RepID=UPI0026260641|nr:hypothetical protein [uncultured Tenacibaculum sp.]